ncbi:MAG TPA: SDR family NAD(P)-dependent oxidoreductase, partial [Vicinamibacteria bacterium]|nr:SDR family NAD(P)-dependent oxidoreductase [Vicinamibacteria bacterium]
MDGPRLEGKIAVVTGGGTGLGRTLVLALAERGADVAFSYRDSARGAAEAADAVRTAGRRAWTSRADARRPGDIGRFVEQAAAEMGGIDLLVNNVGVFRKVTLADMTEEVLDEA